MGKPLEKSFGHKEDAMIVVAKLVRKGYPFSYEERNGIYIVTTRSGVSSHYVEILSQQE